MSCQFTCNGCGKTIEPVYAFGRWQHPQGWFTKGAEINGKSSGVSACSEACIQKIEAEGPAFLSSSARAKGGSGAKSGAKSKGKAKAA
ncbi:MAG: hypothetical protein ACIARR_07060 [Phycisphaerales bacterium JB059]